MGQRSRKRGRRETSAATTAAAASVRARAGTAGAGAGTAGAGTAAAGTASARRASARTTTARPSRSERRNEAARAALIPLRPGERPWVITVGAVLAALSGLVQLVLFLVGVKLKTTGLKASAGQTVAFAVLMFICAAGMWKMRYWAVLGFMALLAILLLFAAGALIKVSSLLGLVIVLTIVVAGGYLFFKLVRVLSRIQMPKYPGS